MKTLTSLLDLNPASAFGQIRSALEWRIYRPLFLRYAERHRSRLDGVTFIGITGSAGKTTAKALLTAILASSGTIRESLGTANRINYIAEVIASTRPSDDYCVLELSAERRGYFDRFLKLTRPTIGVVTTIGHDQLKAFGSKEEIAAEKGKLIASLPPEGTAVLNADDPMVRGMADGFEGRVVYFGTSEGADLQGHSIRSSWPECLSFTVRYQGKDFPVRTQFCGDHWVITVLAALAAGVAAGVDLADAIKAVASVAPGTARMEPITTPDGITYIRDDWKAPYWSLPIAFDFLRNAKARRKVVVIGTLSDYHGTASTKYQTVGRQALEVADIVFFVGNMATHGLRAERYLAKGQSLKAFPDIEQASATLQGTLRPGDLVLLKGAGPADHLGRLYLATLGPVACWRLDCGKDMLCDVCPQLRAKALEVKPCTAGVPSATAEPEEAAKATVAKVPCQVFVGIGNPGEKYRQTPHNVGFEVLDILAKRFGLNWEDADKAQIAWLEQNGRNVLLVKPQGYVNNTGKCLLNLSGSIGFSAADCVLVQDDMHLSVGTVRTRLKGSDGGHLGIRSTLVAFQSSEIRRVKVGVGAPENKSSQADYLVSPFPESVLGDVDVACHTAADRLLEFVRK